MEISHLSLKVNDKSYIRKVLNPISKEMFSENMINPIKSNTFRVKSIFINMFVFTSSFIENHMKWRRLL